MIGFVPSSVRGNFAGMLALGEGKRRRLVVGSCPEIGRKVDFYPSCILRTESQSALLTLTVFLSLSSPRSHVRSANPTRPSSLFPLLLHCSHSPSLGYAEVVLVVGCCSTVALEILYRSLLEYIEMQSPPSDSVAIPSSPSISKAILLPLL